ARGCARAGARVGWCRRASRTVDGVRDLGTVDRDDDDRTLAAELDPHDVPSDPGPCASPTPAVKAPLFRQLVALLWLRSMAHTVFHTCSLCEATCGLRFEVEDNRIVSVRGDEDDVFSKGYVCPKGIAIADVHH